MAYVQAQSPNRRVITLTGVAALHVALVYALVTGFAAEVLEKVDVVMPIKDYPADPPPSPEPSVEPSAPVETKIFVPKAIIDLPKRDSATVIDLTPRPQPTFDPVLPTGKALPQPSPSASFAAKAATPLGNPGKWATSADYPAAELRREIEGTARFRVTIGADGRVRNCEIVSSSGSSGLDRATCENVARRARFKPATDETGAAVSGSYSNAIRWEIPD